MVLPAWTFWTAVVLMLVGLAGVLMPAVPGVGLMWIVILVYAIAERFATIDPLWFTVLTVLGLAGATADIWMSQLGARTAGASVVSMLAGALLGGLIGLFFGGIGAFPAMIIGAILGVFLNEYRTGKAWGAAWRAALGLVVGFTLSTVLQLCIGAAMLAIFVWQGRAG
jgi:uncharacterized protein YqgC (DUF456 family)